MYVCKYFATIIPPKKKNIAGCTLCVIESRNGTAALRRRQLVVDAKEELDHMLAPRPRIMQERLTPVW